MCPGTIRNNMVVTVSFLNAQMRLLLPQQIYWSVSISQFNSTVANNDECVYVAQDKDPIRKSFDKGTRR